MANNKEPVKGHDKCPWCGSEKRLVKDFVDELRANGKISKEAFPKESGAWSLMFFDQKLFSLLQVSHPIPTMQIMFDICGECLKPYITGVEYGEQMFTKHDHQMLERAMT